MSWKCAGGERGGEEDCWRRRAKGKKEKGKIGEAAEKKKKRERKEEKRRKEKKERKRKSFFFNTLFSHFSKLIFQNSKFLTRKQNLRFKKKKKILIFFFKKIFVKV